MWLFIGLPVVSAVAGANPAAGSASPLRETNQTILVLGDSISAGYGIQREEGEQGWVELLQERLDTEGQRARVQNGSQSGWTTKDGRAWLPNLLDVHRPDIVIIELGGNDGLRGLPIDSIRQNLVAMIETAKARDARVIVVGMDVSPNMGQRYREEFRNIYTEVAETTHAALVPPFFDDFDETMLQQDVIHPTAEAQSVILDNIWPELQPMLR